MFKIHNNRKDKLENYLDILDYTDCTLVLSLSLKTSAARLPSSIPGIPTKSFNSI